MANRWGADSYIRGQVESHYNSEPSSLYAEGLENGKAELLLLLRGLLAFGAEFLALLAVKSLGVGLLGAFERRGGARLGHLFVGSGGCCRIALGGGGGLCKSRACKQQRGRKSRCDAERLMNDFGIGDAARRDIFVRP